MIEIKDDCGTVLLVLPIDGSSESAMASKYLRRAQLSGMQLAGRNFRDADLREANFDGADLTDAKFDGANLTKASFSGAKLLGATFDGATLQDADLRNTELRDLCFSGVKNMKGIRVTESELSGIRFVEADLSGAAFQKTSLTYCFFTRCSLDDATFVPSVVFNDVRFDDCALRRTNLWDANLKKVNFTNVRLLVSYPYFSSKTVWPISVATIILRMRTVAVSAFVLGTLVGMVGGFGLAFVLKYASGLPGSDATNVLMWVWLIVWASTWLVLCKIGQGFVRW